MTASCLRQRPPSVRRTLAAGSLAVLTLALNACATPEGTLTYYLPKAQTVIKVTQTIACNAKGDSLVQVVDVSSSTSYASDLNAPVEIRPKAIDGWLSNADIAFAFTDDGRLSGVNLKTVGQGGEVVKGALAVAKAVATGATAFVNNGFDAKGACGVIAQYAAKPAADKNGDAPKDDKKRAAAAAGGAVAAAAADAVVTLSYEGKLDYKRADNGKLLIVPNGANPETLPVAENNAKTWKELTKFIPNLAFYAKVVEAERLATPRWSGSNTDVTIKLNGVANVVVEVMGLKGDLSDEKQLATFWRGEIPVPLTAKDKGDLFDVPIPKAAVFGSRVFSLSLTNYGSISKIQYAATGGVSETAGALAAIGAAWAGASKESTVAQQADAAKAQGDLIFQQQRLALCIAKPENCPK